MFNFKKNDTFSGIDFRDQYITTAKVQIQNNKPNLLDIDVIDTKIPIIENSRMADINGIADLLKERVLDKPVHLAFPTQNIIVRRITSLPDLKEEELAKLLQYQVGESIHLPFEKSIYDFVKIGTLKAEPENQKDIENLTAEEFASAAREKATDKADILFFATSLPLSEDFLEVSIQAGLKPLSAEIRGTALQRLISHTNPDWLRETEMVVDLSKESIDIHIFANETIAFSRTMTVGTTESEQEDLFSTSDVLPFDGFVEGKEEAAASIEETSFNEETYMNDVVTEIEKAQNFFRYSLSKGNGDFQRVIITGKNACQFVSVLSERLEVEVADIDFSKIVSNDFHKKELLNSTSVAIGLALKGNETVKKKWKK
ncbi:pilus assembly protein PilM [Robertmurraya korlensis]|uniref:type IV pilus biogenesis protein PilM n=1 Tax=Robertmurraya korlensis TaxID=519977 RepID=UPI00203E6CB2|nr:pilus assembly protein PilM [Robertmurraya korlensis]MCM3603018.1 pilus assembly protein PilM [Robertmurraya korlensis]